MYYRLADPAICDLCLAIRSVAERRLADLERLVHEHFGDRSDPEPVGMKDLLARVRSTDVIVLDARPASEYEAGHIAGAISVPIDELQGMAGGRASSRTGARGALSHAPGRRPPTPPIGTDASEREGAPAPIVTFL